MYPNDEFICRLWTLYKFIKSVSPMLVKCSQVKVHLKKFLSPKLRSNISVWAGHTWGNKWRVNWMYFG